MPLFAAALILLAPLVAAAQALPPALVVPGKRGKAKPLAIASVDIKAQVTGFLAKTRMTIKFCNPHNRRLAGELYFPLPEGASVSGYALDVHGAMVDGVVVEKKRAQVVFEKEVRKGVDPGLVEWTKGNNFKTRVYPIPAKGCRTVAVEYVSNLPHHAGGVTYSLPLGFSKKVKHLALHLSVTGASSPPRASWLASQNIPFRRKANEYVAEVTIKRQPAQGELTVAIPRTANASVLVERAPDGESFFAIYDPQMDPRAPAQRAGKLKPKSIGVIWDVSASRGGADHARELRLLLAALERLGHTRKIELFLLESRMQGPQSFANADKLVGFLRKVDYDGGTQLGALAPQGRGCDLYLLFSDGLATFGPDQPGRFGAPVYVFNGQSSANHALLGWIGQASGGEYFNLTRTGDEEVLGRIGQKPWTFISAEGTGVTDLLPSSISVLSNGFAVSGRLIADRGTVKLHYGVGGKILKTSEFVLQRKRSPTSDLLRTFWAQMRLRELAVFPRKHQEELTALGKRYNLVTPGTSLMVLETLEQYVEHQIPPPATLPKMLAKYRKIRAVQQAEERQQQQDKLAHVQALWRDLVAWWDTEFKVPKGYRHEAARSKAAERLEEEEAELSGEVRDYVRKEAETAYMDLDADEAPAPGVQSSPKREQGGSEGVGTQTHIALKPWDPDTPYLRALKQAQKEARWRVYLEQREHFGDAPAFYLDCADFFRARKQERIALRVLSNVAELELENAALLRVLAHRLAQLGELELAAVVFEQVLRLRPEEPQSFRDLALVLASCKRFERALELLAHVVMNRWDRFEEIEIVALVELNRLLPKARAAGIKEIPVDPSLIKLLDVDVRIVLTWDADLTDIDVWVIEPSGERAYYDNALTPIGGHVSRDFTDGYGPEVYMIRKAMPGEYKVQVNYFGSQAQTLSGAVTLQLDLFTAYGRKDEKRRSTTVRLTESQETLTVGTLSFQ